jgi:hypothetical protein
VTPSNSQPAEPAPLAVNTDVNVAVRGAGGPAEPAVTFELDAEAAAAVELARAAAVQTASDELAVGESTEVGDYLGVRADAELTVVHGFQATLKGYQGWFWAVTVARVPGFEPTVDEVVLLPGEAALLAPAWVPWSERLQPGDLSPGDVLPTPADDPRLVPGYLLSDDPAVEEVAFELGQGRPRVLSRPGRDELAERWYEGPTGPDTPMAKQAPAHCGSCGFFLPLAGSLRALFGACGNEITETDGRVVSVDHGCGAHSEAIVEPVEEDHGEVYDDDAIELVEIGESDAVDLGTVEDALEGVDFGAASSAEEGAELGQPTTELRQQLLVEGEDLAVEPFDADQAGGVDDQDEAGPAQLADSALAELDAPAEVAGGVEQAAPGDSGQDLV